MLLVLYWSHFIGTLLVAQEWLIENKCIYFNISVRFFLWCQANSLSTMYNVCVAYRRHMINILVYVCIFRETCALKYAWNHQNNCAIHGNASYTIPSIDFTIWHLFFFSRYVSRPSGRKTVCDDCVSWIKKAILFVSFFPFLPYAGLRAWIITSIITIMRMNGCYYFLYHSVFISLLFLSTSNSAFVSIGDGSACSDSFHVLTVQSRCS